jgi:SAM-dependent methyltransferase
MTQSHAHFEFSRRSLGEASRRIYGRKAALYDAGRPDYPQRVYDVLTERCGLSSGLAVLECGPGTGQVTRHLIDAGAHVTAIEPDSGMAEYLHNSLRGLDVEVITALFEDVELADGRFALAAAANSFHWIDADIGIPKLSRIIRPGGWIAIWWTIFGDPDRADPFGDSVSEVLGYDQRKTWGEQLEVTSEFPDALREHGFLDVESERIDWTLRMSVQDLQALYATLTSVLLRPEPDQRRVLDSLQSLVQANVDGTVERPFVTVLCTGRRP